MPAVQRGAAAFNILQLPAQAHRPLCNARQEVVAIAMIWTRPDVLAYHGLLLL